MTPTMQDVVALPSAGPDIRELITRRDMRARYRRSAAQIQAWTDEKGFPAAAELRRGRQPDRFPADEVEAWVARRFPRPTGGDVGSDERITIAAFARCVGRADETVRQYVGEDGFWPLKGADGNYRAGDLARWWRDRPGMGVGGGARPLPPEAARTEDRRREQIEQWVRHAVERGQPLTVDVVAERLRVRWQTISGQFAEVVERLAPELQLLTRAQLVAHAPGGTAASRQTRLRSMLTQSHAPQPVLRAGRRWYYRSDDCRTMFPGIG
jgi:hypothetical protein